ncbi:MAG: hypothetical protein K5644_04550 [Lachnospiraceae bacterium]|nr:hypothetical protein [Lachnospiraceae bacterium]
MLFPILGIVLVGMVALALRYRYLNKKTDDANDDFYERERRANIAPKKDISNLNYLKIPLEKFPIGQVDDPDIKTIEDKLIKLSEKDILNLTGKTNTDLKEEYGAPNFDKMQEVGENFNDLTVLLVDYGNELMLHNMTDEAITVLEYGIVIGTDMSKNYTMLADCYQAKNQPRRIRTLRDQAVKYEGIMRESILRHIDELLKDDNEEDFETSEDE